MVSPRWGKSKKRVLNAIGRRSSIRLFDLLGKAHSKWWYETDLVEFDPKGVFWFRPDGESRKNAFWTQLDDVCQPGFLPCLEKPTQNDGMKPTSWNSIPRVFFPFAPMGKVEKTRFERNWTTFVNPAFCPAWKSPLKMMVWNRRRGIRSQGCFFLSPRWGKSKKRVLNAIGRRLSTRLFALLGKPNSKWWYETDVVEFDPKGVFSFRPDGESRKNAFWTQLDDVCQPGFLLCLEKPTQNDGMKPTSWNSIPRVFFPFAPMGKVEKTRFERNWTTFVNPAFCPAWKSALKMMVWNRRRGIRSQGCFFLSPRWGKSKKRVLNAIGRRLSTRLFALLGKAHSKWWYETDVVEFDPKGVFSFRPDGESRKNAFWTQLDDICQPGFLPCLEKPTQNDGMKPTSWNSIPRVFFPFAPMGKVEKTRFERNWTTFFNPAFCPAWKSALKMMVWNRRRGIRSQWFFFAFAPMGKVEKTRFERHWTTFVNPAFCPAWKSPHKMVVWNRPSGIRSQGCFFVSPRWGKSKKRVLNAIGRRSSTRLFALLGKAHSKWWYETDVVEFDPKGVFSFRPDGESRKNAFWTQLDDVRQPGFLPCLEKPTQNDGMKPTSWNSIPRVFFPFAPMGKVEKTRFERNWTTFVNPAFCPAWKSPLKMMVWNRRRGIRSQGCFFLSPRWGKSKKRVLNAIGRRFSTRLFALLGKAHSKWWYKTDVVEFDPNGFFLLSPRWGKSKKRVLNAIGRRLSTRLFALLGKAHTKWWYETDLVEFDPKGVFSFRPDGESRKNAFWTQLDDVRQPGFLPCLEKPTQNDGMKPTSWNSIPRVFFPFAPMGKVEKTRFERNWTTFVNPAFCPAWKSPLKMMVWNRRRGIRSQGCFFLSPRWGKSKKRVLNAIGRRLSTRLFALLGKAHSKWWYETDLVEFDPKGVFSFRPDGESRKNAFWTQLDDVCQPGFLPCLEKPTQNDGMKPTSWNSISRVFFPFAPMGKVEKTRFERIWTTFVNPAFCPAWKSPLKMVVWNRPSGIRSQGCFFVSPRWGKSKKRVLNAIGRRSSTRLFALLGKAHSKWWYETDVVEFDLTGVFSFRPDGESRKNAFWTQLDDVCQPGFLPCLEKRTQNDGMKPTSWNSIPRVFFPFAPMGKVEKTRFERNWTTFVNPAFCPAWKSPLKMVVWHRPSGIRSQGCFFVSPRWGKSKKRVLNAIGRRLSTRLFALLGKAHSQWWYETDVVEFDPKGVFSFRPDGESRKNAFWTQLDDVCQRGFLPCLEKPTQNGGMKPTSWNSIPRVLFRFAPMGKGEKTRFERNWTTFVNPAFCPA